MNRIDGMPTEFEWKIFSGITALASSRSFQNYLQIYSVNRSTSKAGSSSCPCLMTLYGMQKETKNNVYTIHRQLQNMLANSLVDIGLSWGLHQKRNGADMAEEMMDNFSRSGHPIFRATSAFPRGELRIKGGGNKSKHFNGSNENIELPLRTVISANQLSIYGAVADLCDDIPGKPAPMHLEKVEIPTVLSKAENSTNEQQWWNLRQEYEQKVKQLSEDQKLTNCVLMRVWSLLNESNTSILLTQKKDNRCNTYAESTRCVAMKGPVWEDWFEARQESVQSWT